MATSPSADGGAVPPGWLAVAQAAAASTSAIGAASWPSLPRGATCWGSCAGPAPVRSATGSLSRLAKVMGLRRTRSPTGPRPLQSPPVEPPGPALLASVTFRPPHSRVVPSGEGMNTTVKWPAQNPLGMRLEVAWNSAIRHQIPVGPVEQFHESRAKRFATLCQLVHGSYRRASEHLPLHQSGVLKLAEPC